jgi:hypothetical protein
MRRKLSLLLLAHSIALTLLAQKGELPAHSRELTFKGFVIQVTPSIKGGFGYNISKDGSLLIQQLNNPFTGTAVGLSSPEDAIKVAKWYIQEELSRSSTATALPSNRSQAHRYVGTVRRLIPVNVAKELKIERF